MTFSACHLPAHEGWQITHLSLPLLSTQAGTTLWA